MTLDQAEIDAIIRKIKAHKQAEQKVYLVGGAIRDTLLQRSVHDLDFVTNQHPIALGRQLADNLQGDFFILDHERQTARVLYNQAGSKPITIDFALLRGNSLEEDLRGRDFTLNAIAMDVEHPEVYIDPLQGGKAVLDKTIQVCSEYSFIDDPLRILRMLRIALETGFSIQKQTLQLAKSSLHRLVNVSVERVRDELFKLMELSKPDLAVRLLEQVGILKHLMPFIYSSCDRDELIKVRVEEAAHTLAAAKILNSVLIGRLPDELTGNLVLGQASLYLGQYRYQLEEHFNQQLNPQRSHLALFNLAALLTAVGDGCLERENLPTQASRLSGVSEYFNSLALSQNECCYLETLTTSVPTFMALVNGDNNLSRRSKYQYFNKTGETGIDTILLSLAVILGRESFSLNETCWRQALNISRQLMQCWWEERDLVVAPKILLNGTEIIDKLGIPQGPRVGRLLRDLREEQAAGTIETVEDAWEYLELRKHQLDTMTGDENG